MRISGFVWFLLCPFFLWAQSKNSFSPNVKNTQFKQQDNTIVVTYDLEGKGVFDITAYYSSDNGESYDPISRDALKGDIGTNIRNGKGKGFTWDLLKNMPGFVGPLTIKIEAKPSRRTIRKQRKPFLITLSAQRYTLNTSFADLGSSYTPVGGRLGLGRRWGIRASYLSSTFYQESYVTFGISKSLIHSRGFSWNFYPSGGILIDGTGLRGLKTNEWLIGGGSDLVIGPLSLNVDVMSTFDGQLRTSAGIGWAFRMY
ncbi:MAG: hypothetical protein AAFQ83_02765 [Bacteroidota bacterium]